MASGDLALIFTSIARPHCARRLIESVRQHCPELPIFMNEQIDGESDLTAFCAQHGVGYRKIAFDAGLSAARNDLVRTLKQPYFVLADDDFVFDKPPDFARAVRFLQRHEDVVCVGGSVTDLRQTKSGYQELRRSRVCNLMVDRTGRGIVTMPLDHIEPPVIRFEDTDFMLCDYIPNWGVFRTAFLADNDFWWDEGFKTGGQHLDFFLRLKLDHPAARVSHDPQLHCLHMEGRTAAYDDLRQRRDWLDHFRSKWGFLYCHEVGGAFRRYASYFDGDIPLDTKQGHALRKALADVEWHRTRHESLRQKLAIERGKNAESTSKD